MDEATAAVHKVHQGRLARGFHVIRVRAPIEVNDDVVPGQGRVGTIIVMLDRPAQCDCVAGALQRCLEVECAPGGGVPEDEDV